MSLECPISINSIHPQNTENAAMFIVRFAVMYFFTVLSLVGLNLVAWDRRDTRPSEEVDWNSQINFFTDPERVTTNMYGTVGMVRLL